MPEEPSDNPAVDDFTRYRPLLFSIAYRMLGSVADAEDILQEAFLRWHGAADIDVQSSRAYLVTIVSRLCINHLQSARVRREEYVGQWLPEPIVTEPQPDPLEISRVDESLSIAFLVLLERLSPVERAVFLLREVFDYPYPEVAEIIGTDVDSARHLVARARQQVRDRRPRYHATRREREDLAHRFLAAAQQGDLPALEALLAQDVAMHADGGGKVPALARPLNGRDRVARALAAGMAAAARFGVRIEVADVNGEPGALAFDQQDRLVAVIGLDIAEGQIQTIHSVVNPDKLRHFDGVGDLAALVRDNRRHS